MFQNKTIQIVLLCIGTILCSAQWISTPLALVLGFLITFLFGNHFMEFQSKFVKIFLQIAIVGLGFGMELDKVIEVGKSGLGLTIFSITTTLALGVILGKFFKLDRKLSYLISCGTAICGGSAIAATSSVIKPKSESISISLGVVFLLNSIALIIFPPIGRALGLSQEDFGLWSAIAIHDTSSVVGAAMNYGKVALETATTVKLARALWIIPISLVSMYFFKEKGAKFSVPRFIILFILAVFVNSFLSIPPVISDVISFSSKSILILTIFLIGMSLSVEKLAKAGIKPLSQGVILWIVISVSSLAIILWV